MGGLITFLFFYIPYYCVWWMVSGSSKGPTTSPPVAHNQHRPNPRQQPVRHPRQQQPAPRPQPVAVRPKPVPANRPLSIKQWKVARRAQLAQVNTSALWAEVTGSWVGSAIVLAVFGTLAALFQIGASPQQPILITMVWSSLVALASAWLTIGLGKRWQKEEGDWAIRCFAQLTGGFLVGLFAYGLAEFLMVPWASVTEDMDIPTRQWQGFFGPDKISTSTRVLGLLPIAFGSGPMVEASGSLTTNSI